MTEIHAISPSIRRTTRRPLDFATLEMSENEHATLTLVALGIFADCVNRGSPFQDAILAVYLSGLQHGGSNG